MKLEEMDYFLACPDKMQTFIGKCCDLVRGCANGFERAGQC